MSKPRRKVDWTAEQDQIIIALRECKRPWNDIAEQVGRSVEACSCRYRKILPKPRRVRFARRTWTPEDEALLDQLLAEKLSPLLIASRMGKTRSAVNSKIQSMRLDETRMHFERVPRVEVPERCLEDRDRRLAAERSLTATFFGDPAPGQSALDKRQGTHREEASFPYHRQGSLASDGRSSLS